MEHHLHEQDSNQQAYHNVIVGPILTVSAHAEALGQ